MAAAAFAEAAEFETARQFIKQYKTANKKVLLSTNQEEITETIVRYAMKLCKRIGGSLEILHLLCASEKCWMQMKQLVDGEELLLKTKHSFQKIGSLYQPVLGDGRGCLAEEVLEYTAKRRDILCIVFDGHDQDEARCEKANTTMIAKLQKANCPVVMYRK